ncbi:MAG: hypothetical protein WCL00_08830 [Bacteroidota bacterium]
MLQSIITGSIVILVIGITLYRVIGYFRNPLKGCSGCSSNCGTCALEDLKKEIEEKKGDRTNLSIQN